MLAQPPATATEDSAAMRARFGAERRAATRSSVFAGGAVAIVAFPLWSAFDHLRVGTADAWEFTAIRLLATALLIPIWLLLLTDRGRRRPEWIGLAILSIVEIGIAAMVVQLDEAQAAYALGMSLAIYGSGLLLVWDLRYTLALIGISLSALALGWALVGGGVSAAEVATVAFYLVTASAIALVAQTMRDRAAWREFQIKSELEAEQVRAQQLVQRLDRLSHEDSLTGLANRRAWDEALGREIARYERADGEHRFSVLLCDVDQLKEINDAYGHGRGDDALHRIAELLRERTRAADLVARIGGDEFAVLASDADELDAAKLAEDLRALVEEARIGAPGLPPVTISLGVAEAGPCDSLPGELMTRADRRLYAAKARRNFVCAGEPAEPAGA